VDSLRLASSSSRDEYFGVSSEGLALGNSVRVCTLRPWTLTTYVPRVCTLTERVGDPAGVAPRLLMGCAAGHGQLSIPLANTQQGLKNSRRGGREV